MAKTYVSRADRVVARARQSFETSIMRAANNVLIASCDTSNPELQYLAREALAVFLRIGGSTASRGRVQRFGELLTDTEALLTGEPKPEQPDAET